VLPEQPVPRMSRFMRRLINEIYPGTFPARQNSPEEPERLRKTGQGLARYRP
jgi:hypothetical protein